MYRYTAYGLGIHSTLELPELVVADDAPADVVIRRGPVDRSFLDGDQARDRLRIDGLDTSFYWEIVGAYHVHAGREIVVDPRPDVEARNVRVALLGPVLATILRQRGILLLHASAAVIAGRAVAFVGYAGQGKSTMTATLYGRGHTVLTDDVLAIDLHDPDRPLVAPGFPQMRLLPESAIHALGEDPDLLPTVATVSDKRSRLVRDRFASGPVPLASVSTLAEGPAPRLTPLPPRAAFVELLQHSYIAQYGKLLLEAEKGAAHFRQLTTLQRAIRVYRLERPRALELLPAVAALVEETARAGRGLAVASA